MHTASQKIRHFIFDHNSNKNCPIITIIFGALIAETKASRKTMSLYHLYMSNKCTKNYCNKSTSVQIMVEIKVACFFLRHSLYSCVSNFCT